MTSCDHRVQLHIEKAGIEMKLLCVAMGQGGIRIHNAHQLHIMLIGELLQESGNMPVLQANDGDPNRLPTA